MVYPVVKSFILTHQAAAEKTADPIQPASAVAKKVAVPAAVAPVKRVAKTTLQPAKGLRASPEKAANATAVKLTQPQTKPASAPRKAAAAKKAPVHKA